jgi:hypothetical protein
LSGLRAGGSAVIVAVLGRTPQNVATRDAASKTVSPGPPAMSQNLAGDLGRLIELDSMNSSIIPCKQRAQPTQLLHPASVDLVNMSHVRAAGESAARLQ